MLRRMLLAWASDPVSLRISAIKIAGSAPVACAREMLNDFFKVFP